MGTKTILTVSTSLVMMMSGCVSQPELVNNQSKETISQEDIREFNRISSQEVDVETFREEARHSLVSSLTSLREKRRSANYSDDGKDRFSNILESYKGKEI